MDAVAGATLSRGDGHYGNGLLSRHPITATRQVDLTFGRREPRGAIAADIECPGRPLKVVATHLGLRPAERRAQVERLLALFNWRDDEPAVLLGDLNEWFLWGRPLRRLHRHFEETPACATFPSYMPIFALDRVWAHPGSLLRGVAVNDSVRARAASDHLPLVATLELRE
jgi:endonuclease/exonuclease/phosphatase family metal-dependent hydrolase